MINTVALFSDKTILPGTHATLVSLLTHHINKEKLHIILFADKLSKKHQSKLEDTFLNFKKANQSFEIRNAPNTSIKGANSLQGNTTTYGRLFLADLLPDIDQLLYLDTDLIVQLDVTTIFKKINDDFILYVDGCNLKNYSIDRVLFQKAGLNMNSKCFNAGVLGMNLKKWRENNGLQMCLDTIEKFPNSFISADQAVLNVVFDNQFCALGPSINSSMYWNNKYDVAINDEKIFHFVGGPKPWDFLANKIHYNYKLWKKYYDLSSIANENHLKYTSLKRIIKLIPTYLKTLTK
ncbi:hypothetical protein I5M32_03715 [Pedobacter sp. SD-b]|uniref:Lipopolysaccharide biosynthesis protein, LPS:glycosyltransferase n=1 Tax=Pedobacter segetis TaxID=2793069 RepID=A0ABS1BGR2_9SPHI|nr:glycosyltransferase [Pedobacter segetis]MBK0382057.1 hypothetical protein [Pedobacter segetis]